MSNIKTYMTNYCNAKIKKYFEIWKHLEQKKMMLSKFTTK